VTIDDTARQHVLVRWWSRRTLHARLSLLVTGAVAAAVVTLAVMAWLAVAEIQHHQIQSALTADANAIAAQPDQWLTTSAPLPDPNGQRDDGHHRPHQLGPRWQILDAHATVISETASPLPVTAAARQVATGQRKPVEEQVIIDGDSYLMLTVPTTTTGGAVQVAINQDPATNTLTLFALLLAAGCALGIAGAALLGRTVARAGLAPVQRLTEAVEDVAVTMDLNHPIPVRGVDEIARLGRSVNTMLGAIDTARRAQRTLVEDAGHELRTPLTSIRTNIELLVAVERQPELAHRLPPEERAKLLRDLEAQVGELTALTTELVELAREETTREEIEPVELTDVVTAAINRVRIRAPRLTFTTDLQPVTVEGRPGELERMVVNVLDNAAKWSPPDATVHTELRADGPGWWQVVVTDTGPGIDEADRPYVFDRFYRATAARAMPGSGLGLAIVAQTVTQHGGTVTVEPHTPHGTVITIRLPDALSSVAAVTPGPR
jgi:two-component system sensor histidine kinase MprB